MSSSYPLTKRIVFLKATEFLFVHFLLLLTHVQFSFVFFLLATTYFLLLLLYGSPQQVESLLVRFLCLVSVAFSLKLLQVHPCEQEVLPISLLLVHPPK